MNKIHLHWICPEPTPYHAAFFNELDKDPGVSLEVHFTMGSLPSHPWQSRPDMPFRHRIIRFRFGFDARLFALALDQENTFVVSGWNTPFLIVFILWLALTRRKFLFWSDTPNPFKTRPLWKRAIHRAVSTMTFRAAHKILVTGRPGIEAFSAMGCPTSKLVSFPYFSPVTNYDPSWKEGGVDDTLVLVSAGRINNAAKGFDLGLQALRRAIEMGGPARFEFLICGTGPDLDGLRDEAHHLGLASNVKFLGWLEPDEVTAILRKAHIMLHPAIWEPYGLVIVEAMINGVVVLGSEGTCAAKDRITHGKNGFLHPTGDVNELGNQLAILFHDRERLRAMGIAARQTAEEWPLSRGVGIIKSALSQAHESYEIVPCKTASSRVRSEL